MQERMRELVDKLNDYSRAYYENDAPKISDAEYDRLFDELVQLERDSGETLADSPTRRVGGEPLKKFEQHVHLSRLWSLDKVRAKQDLIEWAQRAEKLRAEYNALNQADLPELRFSLEYKFDGLTVNLTYRDGRLTDAATRGNGTVGEAILPQIMTVRSIPLEIPFKGVMEVQGEGIMRLSVLESFNRTANEPLKNARNAAAGALRNLDPKVTASRRLDCFFYSIGYMEGAKLDSHEQAIDFIARNGLPVSPFMKVYDNIQDVFEGITEAEKQRDTLDFLIDGMVVKICDMRTRLALGATDRFPRWAIAYKFAAEETTTTVNNVTWEVGRTGKLTPRAYLEPVELAGATISHATLNNFDDIQRKRVGIGSRVFIRRSNDVIPEILGAVEGDKPVRDIVPPHRCPACGAHVEQRGVHIFCTNTLSCPPQIAAALAHYASREAMDIEGFSEKTAAQLVEAVNLRSIADLYDLKPADLMALDGFKTKKTTNLTDAIQKSKRCKLGAFLYAIGIPNVGAKTARDIAKVFGTLENVRKATYDELIAIPDIGGIVAQSVLDYFADDTLSAQLDRLITHGVEPEAEKQSALNSAIAGKTVVVTGGMERMGRADMEALISTLGGKASSSVSKKTDLVVAGPGAGTKLNKARELGVRVVDENEFFEMIQNDYETAEKYPS